MSITLTPTMNLLTRSSKASKLSLYCRSKILIFMFLPQFPIKVRKLPNLCPPYSPKDSTALGYGLVFVFTFVCILYIYVYTSFFF